MVKKALPFMLFLGIVLLYLVIRIKPLWFQTVGYTYDQGRDFLKAAEMVMTHRPTFIGPTTGINGLYHGAWWYYVLIIPFLLFKGSPIGFYYFNLLIHLSLLLIFFLFAKKYFGLLLSLLLSLLITLSPYFTFTSLFVGNNIMVLPIMLGFLIVNFKLIEEKKIKYPLLLSFFAGLFLGLIGEFELSFGLFLIPAYFAGIIIFSKLRSWYFKLPHLCIFLLGLSIAFTPRILFEIKNKFIQTKTLLSFFFKPKLYNPKPYIDVVIDRLSLFMGYYEGIFPHIFLTLIISVFLLILIMLAVKKKINLHHSSLSFFSYLAIALFILSTMYKDNFWVNYYEGIQYIFLFIIAILLSATLKKLTMIWNKVLLSLITILIFFGIWQGYKSIATTPVYEGLAVQRAVVSYIQSHEKNINNYCVRIYTPPVIPHTYNYLFKYQEFRKNIPQPSSEWVKGTCWFIMEPDPYKERLDAWKKVNEPEKKAKVTSKKIQNVLINHYEISE